MKRNRPPGYNQSDAPDIVTRSGHGKATEIWFRGKDAPPPSEWHTKVPHRTNPDFVVYFRYIVMAIMLMCAGIFLIDNPVGEMLIRAGLFEIVP